MLSRGARMLNPALTKSRSKVSNSAFTREARASMSVNDRASLETTRASLPSSFCAEFQACLRAPRHQNTRTPIEKHLRRREPHAARAADNHRLFTFVAFHMYSCMPGSFELFSMIIRRGGCGQGIIELFIQNTVRPVDGHVAATGAPSGRRARGGAEEKSTARDLDDGLPRGFLAGAIVKMWVAQSPRLGR